MLETLTFKLKDGTELVLSIEDARALHDALDLLFGRRFDPHPYTPPVWAPQPPINPYWPYIVTCEGGTP